MTRTLYFALLLAACGGKGKSATTENHGGGEAAPMARGTTGFPGLDWRTDAATIQAAYPDAKPVENGLSSTATLDGRPATVTFALTDGALTEIDVTWTDAFASMDTCLAAWKPLRTKTDADLGPSQAENGAAYWTTASASIELMCNPRETDDAEMAETFQPLEAD